MFFIFLALFGSVSAINNVYPVHREDYIWNGGEPPAAPYQAYSVRPPPGVYRVSRREFLSPYQRPYPYYQPPPPPPPPLTQYYIPKLFVPAPNQVLKNLQFPIVVASQPPSTRRPIQPHPTETGPIQHHPTKTASIQPHPTETAATDESVLSATRGPSADEAEPLPPFSEHSNRETKQPNEYFSYNDDVEITGEQMDLLASRKPFDTEAEKLKAQSDHRFRRQVMFTVEVPSEVETEAAPLPQPDNRLSDDLFMVPPFDRLFFNVRNVPPQRSTMLPQLADNEDTGYPRNLENNEVVDEEHEFETVPPMPIFPDEDSSTMTTTENTELQLDNDDDTQPSIACEYRAEEELKLPQVFETEDLKIEISPVEQVSSIFGTELQHLINGANFVSLLSGNDEPEHVETVLRCSRFGCIERKKDDTEEERAIPQDEPLESRTAVIYELSEDGKIHRPDK